jgi:hypothetical protein
VCLAVQCSNFRIDADTVLLEMSLRVAEGWTCRIAIITTNTLLTKRYRLAVTVAPVVIVAS